MIDQLTIDRIRDNAQILDVVSEFVVLRRRGVNYVGLCPFHADKSPSFYVSPSKNICKCFSCGEGGDPIHFLMKNQQMSYLEAIRWLGKKYGIEIEEREMSAEEREAETAREGMLNLNEFVMHTFEEDLYYTPEGKNIGLTYFYERGLQDEIIKRYHLGYALQDPQNLPRRALEKQHRREFMLTADPDKGIGTGLCYENKRHELTNRFAGRVIFPYMSLSGKVVAFGGRILQRVDHAAMKYVNSPESAIYHKGNMLYGIFQAKQEIAKQDKCFIVEGNVDVLSMAQAGLLNTVASAGTALTTNQIRLIRRFTKNVVLMYDGDNAGINASLKTIDLLLLEGMNVKLLLLPDGEDPDSFCRKHSASEVKEYFDRYETDFIAFKGQMLMRAAGNDPIKHAGVVQNIVQSIALISDPIISSIYVRQAAQMLNTNEMAIMNALQQQKQNNYAAELRQFEMQQRQQMLRQSRMEQLKAEGMEETAANEAASKTEMTTSMDTTIGQDKPAFAEASLSASNTNVTQSFGMETRLTDRFERNIIKYIVRYGGNLFTLRWIEPDGTPQEQQWRVIDYIGYDLTQDEICFQHPLYARMYQMALDASADPGKEFNSIRFFCSQEDPDVNRMALELSDDRYDALGIVDHNEELEIIIPRCLLELKEAIVRNELKELHQQLRSPNADTVAILQRMNDLNLIKKALDKDLGERIITR